MKISPQERNKSSRFDIYPMKQRKIPKILLFMPESIFSGPKLYNPLHFPGFAVKQKIHMFNFSRRLISKTTAATPLVN